MENKSIFETLNAVNVNCNVERKKGLSYLPWAWAWAEVKKRYPKSYYTIYEDKNGMIYHTDGKTCWVKTGVTVVDGDFEQEHIEYLPVMKYDNSSIKIDDVTSFDVNKAIQRSLTKACARHGLGLYVYAGEDLPEEEAERARFNAADEIKAYCTANSISMVDFAALRKSVIASGLAPDVSSHELDKDGCHKLFEAIKNQMGGAA